MLKTIQAAALAVSVMLTASSAAAEPFQTFLKACVTSDANATAAISAVGDLGWKQVPAEAFAEDGGGDIQNMTMHVNFDPQTGPMPDSIEMLMTGQADGALVMDAPGTMMDLCGVLAPDGEAEALIRQVSAHFGGHPQLTETEYTAWVYSRQNNRIVLEADLADTDEAILGLLRQRPLFAVYVVQDEDMSGVMLGAFRATK